MDRRNFVRLGVAGGVAALFTPALVNAGHTDHTDHTSSGMPSSALAGGIYYTAANPGRWSKKVSGHLPVIEKASGKIQVITGHAMKAHQHYITKHMLLDHHFNFLAEVVFDPLKDKTAKSVFKTHDYSGKIYVLSHCNKHDTWLNTVTL